MAEVTVNSVKRTVTGNVRSYLYNISGSSGSTLTVGFNKVNFVSSGDTALTAYSVAAGTNPGTSTITLTGTFSSTDVEVVGN